MSLWAPEPVFGDSGASCTKWSASNGLDVDAGAGVVGEPLTVDDVRPGTDLGSRRVGAERDVVDEREAGAFTVGRDLQAPKSSLQRFPATQDTPMPSPANAVLCPR